MNNEELRLWVKQHDRKVGLLPHTIKKGIERREEKLKNVPQKVIDVAEYLIESGIDFHIYELLTVPKPSKKKHGLTTTIFIPEYRIAMRYEREDMNEIEKHKSDVFFRIYKRIFFPFYIRESESIEFIKEKLDNCIKSSIEKPKETKLPDLTPTPTKRERMKAVKVKY